MDKSKGVKQLVHRDHQASIETAPLVTECNTFVIFHHLIWLPVQVKDLLTSGSSEFTFALDTVTEEHIVHRRGRPLLERDARYLGSCCYEKRWCKVPRIEML